MIIKERKIPLVILILEALCRRLSTNHPKYKEIQEELGRRRAGYQGEVAFDYYLRYLPKDKYMILHDLNLPDGEYNCQIDTLLISPEYALIIEVKNMTGKLIFDTENEQFIQIYNEKEKGYPYPIAQAERHQEYLRKLLKTNKFPDIPTEYVVVISNSYATYAVTGKNAYKVKPRVGKADVFQSKIQYFEDQFTKPALDSKDLRKLCRRLVKMNTVPTNYVLRKYGINKYDLSIGVFCPRCNHYPIIEKRSKWFCPSCNTYSKDAHINALMDYFLLIDTQITNQQFRDFCQLTSSHTSKRFLVSANLSYDLGTKKGRSYSPKTIPW
ncbi:nuclease-related domain-containing protein [Neobacillus cucumis]|uniref:NERD nuclease n=1 Tax=Neobacillus cucumis TaxID=1740721 RepID=A0A2N5HAS7_9BACI|nr:nuclease-related domain-containing protein [Neobacillus cucumis]PLS02590.1 NERD nuclease [Neobacillus cucumis]